MSKLTNDIYGKKIKTRDGRTGYLNDLSIDGTDWRIRSMVWTRGSWFPWTKHLLGKDYFGRLISDIDSYYFTKPESAKGNIQRTADGGEVFCRNNDEYPCLP